MAKGLLGVEQEEVSTKVWRLAMVAKEHLEEPWSAEGVKSVSRNYHYLVRVGEVHLVEDVVTENDAVVGRAIRLFHTRGRRNVARSAARHQTSLEA